CGRDRDHAARPHAVARTGAIVKASDKRKTLIWTLSYDRQRASIGSASKGMEHACTPRNLVRVRAANRIRERPPAEQGRGHEHAPLHEGRQRKAPGDHLGRIRADREQPQSRGVRERRLDEADAEALTGSVPNGGPWGTRSARPLWPPSSNYAK